MQENSSIFHKLKINTPVFHKLSINDGIELLAISKNNKIFCFKPYFKSKSPIKIKITDEQISGDCEFEKKNES